MSLARPAPSDTASSTSQEQSPRSLFLRLPPEVAIAIVSRLPQHNQILVSQTCHSLRDTLRQYLLREKNHLPERLPRRERIEFLQLIARDKPDRWVCEVCLSLHQARIRDTPRRPWSANCPFGESEAIDLRSHRNHGFKLSHRHVQLMLKHTRLADTVTLDETHLQKHLAPYHRQIRSRFIRRHVINGRYFAYPKVVEGRYLLHSVQDFHEWNDKVLPQYLGRLTICQHQAFHARDPNLPGRLSGSRISQDERRAALNVAVEAAFNSPGEEISGRCELCGTDFSVEASPARVTVRAWHDFGPEGTSRDPHWRSHTSLTFSKSTPCRLAGSIRKMYGE